MKLLLVNPEKQSIGFSKKLAMLEPLSLEYLAAGVTRAEVKILDLRINDTLVKTVLTWKPDVVGITGYTMHAKEMKNIAYAIKSINPHTKVIVGGHHATFHPESFFDCSVDIIARWECEGIMDEILVSINSNSCLSKIPGVIFSNEPDNWIRNDNKPIPVFPCILPKRNLISENSKKYHLMKLNCSMLQMSRGCPYGCDFCDVSSFSQRKFRAGHIDTVLADLDNLPAPYVLLADDNVGINSLFINDFLNCMTRKDKRFIITMGSREILGNRTLLDRWFSKGLKAVFLGIERVTDESIKSLGKKTTTDINDSTIRYIHSNGGLVIGSFVILPTDTEENFKEIEDYIRTRQVDIPLFCVLTPFPGTKIWDKYKDIIHYKFEEYDFMHCIIPTTLPEDKFYSHLYHLYQYYDTISLRKTLWRLIKTAGISYIFKLPELVSSVPKRV